MVSPKVSPLTMLLPSNLIKNRCGVWYFRIRKNGKERRISLRIKDDRLAKILAYRLGVFLNSQKIDEYLNLMMNGQDLPEFESEEANYVQNHISTIFGRAPYYPPPKPDLDLTEILSKLVDAQALSQNAIGVPVKNNESCLTSKKLVNAMVQFRVWYDKQGKSKATYKLYDQVFRDLQKEFGNDFLCEDFTNAVIVTRWQKKREKSVSTKTVLKEYGCLRSLIDWGSDPLIVKFDDGRREIYFNREVYDSLETKYLRFDKPLKSESYEHFTKSDFEKLFESILDRSNPKLTKLWHFWLPFLGLYFGARIEDLINLETQNFYKSMGLDCVFIDGKKNIHSKRNVPLHPDLISLGLLDMVDYAKSKNQKFLFFDLGDHDYENRGKKASSWFGPFRRNAGVGAGLGERSGKVFHSFRHTLTNLFNQNGILEKMQDEYIGHAPESQSVGRVVYGSKPIEIVNLKAHLVDKIDYMTFCDWSPDLAASRARFLELIDEHQKQEKIQLEKKIKQEQKKPRKPRGKPRLAARKKAG